MKLFKSLLLGSAAGLIAVSGASAADLGVKKPAPVEYVKVCSAHGAGFFYVPGSDICIQFSGRVRAEYLYATPYTRGDDFSSFRSNGRLNVDVRQTTQYGLLRAYIRYDVYGQSGRYNTGSATAFGPNSNATNAILDKAFIQFYTGTAGFFTAGRSVSFFDFYANNDNWTSLPGSDRANTNLFAYTATFGGGFSATLSVEDTIGNRRTAGASFAGQSMPDIVGNLRVDQAWGSAQLSAAVHQMRFGALQTPTSYYGTTYGFAVQGGVKINLPMIAAGDTLWLQAAYGDGATIFTGASGAIGGATFGSLATIVNTQDAFLTGAAGGVKKVKSWSALASFVHNFTPTIQGAVYGGYGSVNNPVGTSPDFKTYGVGAQLSWIPVRNFRIGTEVMYNVVDPKGTVATGNLLIPSKGKYDGVTARLRFQRDF